MRLLSLTLPLTLLFACRADGKSDPVAVDSGVTDSGIDGAGLLACDVDEVDFGVVFVGQGASEDVEIQNVGDGAVSVSATVGGGSAAAFTASVANPAPAPGTATDVSVTWTPAEAGQVSASLLVTDTIGGGAITVLLTGQAQIDNDGDDVGSVDSGGEDCDDDDATIYTGAEDVPNDGIDQDCDGVDNTDGDGDGYGYFDECDDSDPSVNPDATEIWYDGIDQDCAGDDDYDQDADGSTVDVDCDDTDATVLPGATETWYDGIDQDCNGGDDYDQDGDGSTVDDDCDDLDATSYPGATEIWYDGIDQDCAGDTDDDRDGDGFLLADDCDDDDATAYPGGADVWYDGVDGDCAGDDDFDQDLDGYALGVDCDDTDATLNPGAVETWYDGVDTDCSGGSDNDQDGDGSDVSADCDDLDAASYPGAPEIWYDGIDQDCAGDDDDDQDGDGVTVATDCDDTDASIGVATAEVWDGVDNDCDGLVDNLSVDEVASGVLYGATASLALGGRNGLSIGGDVTGDNVDDIVVVSGASGDGYGWVVSGPTGAAANGSVANYDTAALTGQSGYTLNSVVGPMMDADGNGTEDLLVAGSLSSSYEGRAWLEAGGSTLTGTIALSTTYTARFSADSNDDLLRTAVYGDIDGDGTADVITGAYYDNYTTGGYYTYAYYSGLVAVFEGGSFTGSYDATDSDDQIAGEDDYDYLGYSLVAADVDGDGYDDIIAGAPGEDTSASAAGAVYIFSGNATLDWDEQAEDAMDVRILGAAASNALGTDPFSAPGDVDGDGQIDLLLTSSLAGAAYLFWDSSSVIGSLTVTSDDLTFSGTAGTFPTAAAYNTDLDGDGKDEIVLGDSSDDAASTDAGAAWFFAPPAGQTGTWTTANATGSMNGEATGDALGSGIAGGGDADGDGNGDLLIGATGSDGVARGGGAVYVILGQ